MNAPRLVVLAGLVLLACSNESLADTSVTAGSSSSQKAEETNTTGSSISSKVEETRAVIGLMILNLKDSAKDDVRAKLEAIRNVAEVKFSDTDSTLNTTTVKCLMKEWTDGSDVGATVKEFKAALGTSYKTAGFSSEVDSSSRWTSLELKRKLGW